MVIILVIVLAFSWFEKEISSYHFKDCASETPNVSRGIVVGTNDNFWGPVLAGLDFRSEVVVGPATVTHITDLNLNIFINFRSSFLLFFYHLFFQSFIIIVKEIAHKLAILSFHACLFSMF